jgi:putative hydrolase of the HAD superfamily
MPGIQVVLFDLGGTLLHYEQPPENSFDVINGRALMAFLQSAIRGGARVPDPELAGRAVARMGAAMEARARRTHHAFDVQEVIREGLAAVNVTVPEDAWTPAMAAYYDAVATVAQPVAGDASRVLETLAEQGRSMGLVSNTAWSSAMHDADLERFGLLDQLPVRVYSSDFGMVKPHPSIYRAALDRLDVAPAEGVFVGDKLDVDVAGPQKIGMRTVLVASPYREENDPEIQPDARISSIDELPALLEAWDREMEDAVP